MTTRRRFAIAAAAALALALPPLVRMVRRLAPPRPNVLFVLVDTLRADRVGPQPGGSLTPFLDRYGAQAVVFERAYAPSSWTVPSIASLFVGQRPFEHGMLDLGDRLPAGALTLAQVLSRHGFDTAAFLASGLMALGGFEYGFTTYRLVGSADINDPPDATAVNAAALGWLDHRDAARPFFLYLHYLEPHYPYRPHEGLTRPRAPELETTDAVLSWRTASGAGLRDTRQQTDAWRFLPAEVQRLNDLYDGEVAYMDRCLDELFTALEARGALANTIVVITSDHGEEFGEHGLFAHGVSLYETVTRVPLIVRLPDARGGARIARPVETAGVAPAVLRTAGLEPPPTFRVAPVPLSGMPPAAAGGAVSQLGPIAAFTIWRHRAALVQGDRKLLVGFDGRLTVHDLAVDAGERAPEDAGPADARRAAEADLTPPGGVTRSANRPDIPADMVERLRALGYVSPPAPIPP